ncbi:hypothetical protein BD410DRAFT_821986 [Rickenella mellea]|uniref:BTB domain-containing protein n=1 Tax=Rickenella mellea TaxID=50990 RepID=A0A4Y7PXN0_9AGAM|nr:hypothetical protein BD410DRAFT_821986 [Rickenella mellea]
MFSELDLDPEDHYDFSAHWDTFNPLSLMPDDPYPLSKQVLSPPSSASSSSGAEDASGASAGVATVSVSTTFFPGAILDDQPADITLRSLDNVFFAVHTQRLLAPSSNGFNNLLFSYTNHPHSEHHHQTDTIIDVSLTSSILNIILHTVYNLSCAHYVPTLSDLTSAVASFPTYGLSLCTYISPPNPLYTLLLSHAPTSPLDIYALAASHNLADLATATSSHLLGISLSSISDSLAERIGPVYLKRLFFLHLGRVDALKRLLLLPPDAHTPTAECSEEDQKSLTRAWALASAYLAWDARPDTSASVIESALKSLSSQLTCELCNNALAKRTGDMIMEWANVKASFISFLPHFTNITTSTRARSASGR